MRNSFNLLLIVLAWFDIFFIIIAVLDYSVARGTSLFWNHLKREWWQPIYKVILFMTFCWWIIGFQCRSTFLIWCQNWLQSIFQCSSGLLTWRASYMSTCSPDSSTLSTTSSLGQTILLSIFIPSSQLNKLSNKNIFVPDFLDHVLAIS